MIIVMMRRVMIVIKWYMLFGKARNFRLLTQIILKEQIIPLNKKNRQFQR